MAYWWLSFADPAKPKGSQFLGAVILNSEEYSGMYPKPRHPKDDDFARAVGYSYFLKLNPGGEIEGSLLPEITDPRYLAIISKHEKRLLTRSECEAIDKEMETII